MTPTSGDLKPGDEQSAAMWFVSPDQKEKAKPYIVAAFERDAEVHGVEFGAISYSVLSGEAAPAPIEPGARMLVGTARVVAFAPLSMAQTSFMTALDPRDLERLRNCTQRAYQKLNPGKVLDTDSLDRMVARVGPELGERLLQLEVAGNA